MARAWRVRRTRPLRRRPTRTTASPGVCDLRTWPNPPLVRPSGGATARSIPARWSQRVGARPTSGGIEAVAIPARLGSQADGATSPPPERMIPSAHSDRVRDPTRCPKARTTPPSDLERTIVGRWRLGKHPRRLATHAHPGRPVVGRRPDPAPTRPAPSHPRRAGADGGGHSRRRLACTVPRSVRPDQARRRGPPRARSHRHAAIHGRPIRRRAEGAGPDRQFNSHQSSLAGIIPHVRHVDQALHDWRRRIPARTAQVAPITSDDIDARVLMW